MGNGLSPCLQLPAAAAAVRLVYWGGETRLLAGEVVTAGAVVAELPAAAGAGHVVCPADAFFVGLPVPVVPPGEALRPGRTYLVLPAARLACGLKLLTAATLAALSPAPGRRVPLAGPGPCPFEYVKGDDGGGGAALIRVLPEFIEKVITCDGTGRGSKCRGAAAATELCSTPELKRHYAQLVGPRSQPWSPGLETITERGKSKWSRLPAARLLSSR
ncbi:hypothetical protein ACP4OV_019474 [Aristida adscensionis]